MECSIHFNYSRINVENVYLRQGGLKPPPPLWTHLVVVRRLKEIFQLSGPPLSSAGSAIRLIQRRLMPSGLFTRKAAASGKRSFFWET
jgi:hypothetical protein